MMSIFTLKTSKKNFSVFLRESNLEFYVTGYLNAILRASPGKPPAYCIKMLYWSMVLIITYSLTESHLLHQHAQTLSNTSTDKKEHREY